MLESVVATANPVRAALIAKDAKAFRAALIAGDQNLADTFARLAVAMMLDGDEALLDALVEVEAELAATSTISRTAAREQYLLAVDAWLDNADRDYNASGIMDYPKYTELALKRGGFLRNHFDRKMAELVYARDWIVRNPIPEMKDFLALTA